MAFSGLFPDQRTPDTVPDDHSDEFVQDSHLFPFSPSGSVKTDPSDTKRFIKVPFAKDIDADSLKILWMSLRTCIMSHPCGSVNEQIGPGVGQCFSSEYWMILFPGSPDSAQRSKIFFTWLLAIMDMNELPHSRHLTAGTSPMTIFPLGVLIGTLTLASISSVPPHF